LAPDPSGRIYIVDQALKRVLRFDTAGIADTVFNAAISQSSDLTSPVALAVNQDEELYVSDEAVNRVLRFDTNGQALAPIPQAGGPARPRAIAAHGVRLYVADAETGSIWIHREGQGWIGTLPGYRGPVSALTTDTAGRLYVKPGLDAQYHVLEPNGACVFAGALYAGPFDAGEDTHWQRVLVQAEIPSNTSVELRLYTADAENDAPTASDWMLAGALDTLVPPPGSLTQPESKRYLWLRVDLTSADGHGSPRLLQIQAETVGESYLDHLPSVYRRDDGPTQFLARWLTLFRGALGDREQVLDDMSRLFDANTTPEDKLQWLAGWLAFELPRMKTASDWRQLLPIISRLYERRGTPFGIREICELYSGARPRLVEAFHYRHVWQLDETSELGFDTGLAAAAPEGMVVPGFIRSDPAFAGLHGDYYSGTNFDRLERTRIDKKVEFAWLADSPFSGTVLSNEPVPEDGPLFPADGFSVRWTGQVRPRHSETYVFSTMSDDGVRLWIDGRLIIDQWNDHAATEHSGRIALEADRWYALTLEYYEKAGLATITLSWSSRSQQKEIVPQSCLYALIDDDAGTDSGGSSDASDLMLVGQTIVGASGPLDAADYGEPLFLDTAHRFTVFLPAARLPDEERREQLKQIIDAEKPAHTDFHLCFVNPSFRVGDQARIGIDTIVAAPPPPGLFDEGVLGRSTRLGVSVGHEASLRVEENFELRSTTLLR
jgi:phage tail-like protein